MARPWTKATVERIKARAHSGDPTAQRELATILASGALGAPKHAEAFKWYRLASMSGDTDAKYNLGLMYLLGEGVERDRRAGLSWLKRAASDGNGVAEEVLGQIYENGAFGSRKNYSAALKWYLAAAKRGNAKAKLSLGVMYANKGTDAQRRKGLVLIRAAARAGVAGAREALDRVVADWGAPSKTRARSASRS